MKRKLPLFILAAIPAAFLSLSAAGQVSSSSGTAPAEPTERVYHYWASAGVGYTSLNQVNQSRGGLIGVQADLARDWGKHFSLLADGAYYEQSVQTNPGKPSVELVLLGPEFHAELYGNFSGFVRALLGGEHTGGESETPNISFAGGFGGGMEYKLSPHLSLRASGDDIYSSFSVINNSPALGLSPHKRANARAAFSVVYRF
ncbi:MAG: hypothetical protein WBE76_00445 [Terracidiphilus sp.]